MALTKSQELAQEKKKNKRLLKMIAQEREKVAGYEQIAKVHSAYIAILLKRLRATADNKVIISAGEVKEALTHYEARAVQISDKCGLYGDGCGLYYEVIE